MMNALKLPTIPAYTLPPLIARLGAHLPQWPHSVNLALALNAAKKLGVLPEDTLLELEGRYFRVTVLDTGMVADFCYSGGSFRPVFVSPGLPDLHFTARLSAFLQLVSRQEDADTLFFNRTLTVEGDTELGLRVKNMLDALEWPRLSWQGMRPTFVKS
jgi:predicted lipid carrier protein YhbT